MHVIANKRRLVTFLKRALSKVTAELLTLIEGAFYKLLCSTIQPRITCVLDRRKSLVLFTSSNKMLGSKLGAMVQAEY